MQQFALCLMLMVYATIAISEDSWVVTGNRAYNQNTGVNYTNQGNITRGSDGSVVTVLQKGVFKKGDVIYRNNGDFYQGSNGVTWHKQGQYWISNDGRQCNSPLFACSDL